jgi:hypothetical protein
LPLRLGERGRLTIAGAAGRIELALQPIRAPLQPVPLAFDLPAIAVETRDLLTQPGVVPQQLLAGQRRRIGAVSRHAAVLPEPAIEYKSKIASRLAVRPSNRQKNDNSSLGARHQ